MIDTVLATDMAVHFDLLNRFKEQIAGTPDISEWKDRTLLYQMLVHLADIANPSRPFHLARGWAERVIEEFCEQVRAGQLGLPAAAACASAEGTQRTHPLDAYTLDARRTVQGLYTVETL